MDDGPGRAVRARRPATDLSDAAGAGKTSIAADERGSARAAFASSDIYEFLEAEGFLYATPLSKNQVLQESIAHLLTGPFGRLANHVRRYYASFSNQAGSRGRKRRLLAKVEWRPGGLRWPRLPCRGTCFKKS
jgi:hypothetical protein